MSDKPLFQNADEQEKAYAPQELPAGTAGARAAGAEEGGEATNQEGVVVPGAAAAVVGVPGGGISGNMGSGATPGMGVPQPGPAIAGAALAPGADRDDDGVVEDEETQGR